MQNIDSRELLVTRVSCCVACINRMTNIDRSVMEIPKRPTTGKIRHGQPPPSIHEFIRERVLT